MPLIWNVGMETGIRRIDLQHRELIEIINAFESAHEAKNDNRAFSEILSQLTSYVLFHFGTEEAMMRNLAGGSEHALDHILTHQAFTDRVMAFKALGVDQQRQEADALLDYLKQWLVEHIMKTDKELALLVGVEGV